MNENGKKQTTELAVYTVILTKERHSRTVDVVCCAVALTLKIYKTTTTTAKRETSFGYF